MISWKTSSLAISRLDTTLFGAKTKQIEGGRTKTSHSRAPESQDQVRQCAMELSSDAPRVTRRSPVHNGVQGARHRPGSSVKPE